MPNQSGSQRTERTYTTEDKTDWGEGPWLNEPDKIQYVDEVTGYPCLVKRNPVGALCGYVGVPEGHPWFGKNYDDVDAQVHGYLTYASFCQEGDEAHSICHIPAPGESDHVWWLGFDCGHSMDICPRMEADYRRRFDETGNSIWDNFYDSHPGRSYKTVGYVREQNALLAQQVKAVA